MNTERRADLRHHGEFCPEELTAQSWASAMCPTDRSNSFLFYSPSTNPGAPARPQRGRYEPLPQGSRRPINPQASVSHVGEPVPQGPVGPVSPPPGCRADMEEINMLGLVGSTRPSRSGDQSLTTQRH